MSSTALEKNKQSPHTKQLGKGRRLGQLEAPKELKDAEVDVERTLIMRGR